MKRSCYSNPSPGDVWNAIENNKLLEFLEKLRFSTPATAKIHPQNDEWEEIGGEDLQMLAISNGMPEILQYA